MRETLTYRPSIEKGELETIITKRLHYKAVNRFIDEAVREKIAKELSGSDNVKMHKLISKLTEVVYEHNGWKFLKPNQEVIKEIKKKTKPIHDGKEKPARWKGSVADL